MTTKKDSKTSVIDSSIKETAPIKPSKKPKKPPDPNYLIKYKDYLSSYKTIKLPLKSITKNEAVLNIIDDAVKNVNKIVTHTYYFLKMYCLHIFDTTTNIPTIDEDLITNIMKLFCKKDSRGAKKENTADLLTNKLTMFKNKYYNNISEEHNTLIYTSFDNVILYEAESMITCISNHIMNNFEAIIFKTIYH